MKRLFRPPAAFSLVEVTLALGIMAFCLVALFGLLPVGFNNNQVSTEQTAAAGVASALVADLRQTPAAVAGSMTDPQSPRFGIGVPYKASSQLFHTLFLTEDGAVADQNAATSPPTSAQDKDADPTKTPRYRATVVYALPANPGTDRTATVARIVVSWPAVADSQGAASNPTNQSLPQHASGTFETVIALDRN